MHLLGFRPGQLARRGSRGSERPGGAVLRLLRERNGEEQPHRPESTLLFDLDGTLTRSAGAGARALGKALGARLRATEELRKMRLDGMTDRAIARALLAAERGTEPAKVVEEEIDHVLEQYLVNLERECAAKSYEAIPGVAAVLDRLCARNDVLLGLKLTSAGLWSSFRFGGYGSDAEPRAEIVRTAWKRAQEHGATEALVIGDTPRDILAAHDAGLPACGVATGRWSVHDLSVHGAEVVLADWSDPDRASSLLLGALR
ncbi:MAG: HAD family hydrolase [Deltaproteobacteria bacterium]|nr:MAG: HAD family hydrolase [Deltaproteobacteria bacterium]